MIGSSGWGHPPATTTGPSPGRNLPRARGLLWLLAVILICPPAIQGQMLSISDATVMEGDDGTRHAEFTVSVSGITPLRITVDYMTADGSATVADGDYQPKSDTLTFENLLPQTVSVVIYGDVKAEPDEMFYLNLSNVTNAVIADGQGQGTIENDDPLPELSIDDVTMMEGNVGIRDAMFTVTLTGVFSETVTVSYATADGTAMVVDNDYQQKADTLTFQPSGSPAQTMPVTVKVNGDLSVEPDETFFVDLSNPVNAVITDARGTGTIQNDDELPELTIGDAMMDEGDVGTTEASLTVTLTGAVSEPVTVSFATEDGTATVADDDYQPVSSETLTFKPDGLLTRTQDLPVHVNGDTNVEPDETFFVNLSGDPDRVTIVDGQGTVTIKNDDEESQLRLTSALSIMENATVAVVTVERVGAGSSAARLTVTADSGTAEAGVDFTAVSGVLKWDAREAGPRSIEVPITDDNIQEDDETVVLRLTEPTGATLDSPAELELVIVDDDTPMALKQDDGSKERTAGANEEIELEVHALRADGTPIQGVTVSWTLEEGDAELLDGEETLTDAGGIATQHVRLGAMPGTVLVTAEIQDTDNTVSFEIEIEGALVDIPDVELSPGEASVATVLDQSCAVATGEFSELCDYIFLLEDSADQAEVLAELTPDEVAAQATASQGSPQVQVRNLSSRLAALRGGATSGRALDQLAFQLRGQTLGVGRARAPVAKRWAGQQRDWLAGALDRMPAAEQEEEGSGGGGGQRPAGGSRLGLFVSGKISIGDRPTSEREAGFDFETLGLTAGLDYRFSEGLIGGLAVGYLDTDTETAGDGGRLDVRGYSLSAYGTYYAGDFFVEGVLGHGRNRYDQVRNVDLPQTFQGQSRFVARGSADGEQLSLSLGGGYEAAFGATAVGGFGRLTWVDAEIDALVERGAGPFNLRISDQTVESLQSEAGLDVAHAISLSWAVLSPTLRLSYLHEFRDDSRLIRGSFVEDATGVTFTVPTESPDRDFFKLSAGFTATFIRGRSAFLLYDRDLGREDLNVYAISLGLRLAL